MERTSDLAPAVKYIIKQSKYPDILDDAALKLFNQRWQYKGLNLNGVLDKDNTLLDVLKDVLNVGFSEPIVKGDKLSFTEQGRRNSNELDYIFQPQNITESPNLTITLPKRDDVQEVVAEYMNPDTLHGKLIRFMFMLLIMPEIQKLLYILQVYTRKKFHCLV